MKPEDLLLAPELSTEEVTEFLGRFGFSDPAAADRNLQLMAEDVTTRLALARMLGKLLEVVRETPDPDGALNHFERLLGVVSHPVNFLGFLGDTAEALEAVLLICGCSSYASEILIRDPETFYWLLNELGAPWPKSLASYRNEARQAISPGWADEDPLRALARFKRREMLRISARDILRVIDVGGTTTELSRLAESVIDCVYEICRARLVSRHGIPQTPDGRGGMREARFTVLGMGKLGGEELNYSSDIDLIYCYDGEEGQTGGGEACSKAPLSNSPAKTISNREFFTKLARMITQALSESTVEGAFYRVDLRLRPEGSTGNVATSLNDYRNYYGSWGETFERLALIKARPVGGCRELGRIFCETFRPFTYRKFLDFASLEELQEIKNRINAKLGSTGKQERHVKLGEGGIREVEFFVQALQLIYGGRHPHLQQAQTVQALEALHRARFLNTREHRGLREAYEFLRDLEHKLQMVFHFQTHELPEKEEDLYKCARRMGIAGSTDAETVDRFRQTYARHTALVHGMFEDLVAWRRGGAAGVEIREAALVLHPGLAEQEAHRMLAARGFSDLRTAYHQITLLRDAPSFAHAPSRMRNLLANLMPRLLSELQSSPDPDAGLSAFESFADALGDRDSLYGLLNESPGVLARLLRLLASSRFLSDFLCRRPEFFDTLVRPEGLKRQKTLARFSTELASLLREAGNDWEKRRCLRRYQQTEMFRIGMKDALGELSRDQVGKQMAGLAECCLLAAFDLACESLEDRFGPGFTGWAREQVAVLAMGKMGGADLSYHSDLDLVYFYADADAAASWESQRRCVRLVERLDEILSVSQGEGTIYHIDTRLRPMGSKGDLVTPATRYREYLATRAEAWERLALSRHRFILGGRRIRRQIGAMIDGFVYQPELRPEEVSQIAHLRGRMEVELGREAQQGRFHLKAGAGGLQDVEFATQLLQLKYGGEYPELRNPRTLTAMARMERRGLLGEDALHDLSEGYRFLRRLENRLRIAATDGVSTISRDPKHLRKLILLLGEPKTPYCQSPEAFTDHYLATTRRVRRHYREIVAKLGGD
ncbi:MAG: bifunctional [glutamate--ammonia ligase]-adenylyl-L-tyrosine phosphorylase/[glutamate--ammonia-ligase] adenylyltransferase [Acidobacteriota bacterium]|nr:bifunctional [glutamate--ammonia ligase]-adenylyl-L-tyrosine phosphorylase/[glutamate--ammonia-ligase] adenylyltransferase [Acidobacteriota bacterium]